MLAAWQKDLGRIRKTALRFLLASGCMGAAWAIPWTLLPLYLDRLGYSKAEIGGVQGAEAWGRALVALPAAFVLGRRRTPPVLFATGLLAALAYFALPWMRGVFWISVVNGLRGLADSVHHVAIAPFLYRHTSARERASVFGLAEAVHTLAAVAGTFLCGRAVTALVPHLDGELPALGWVLSAAGLLPFAASFVFARLADEVPTPGRRVAVLATLREHRGLIVRFMVPQLWICVGAGMVIPFLGLYFQDRFRFSPGGVGNLFACGQVLMTTGFLVSPALLRRFGFVRSIVGVELLSIPFFLILAFAQSLPLAIVAFLFRGALMNTAHPIFKNLMMHSSPEGLRELQNGILALLWGLGWVVGPLIGGRILDATGNDYTGLMCATVVMYALASASSWFLLRPVEAGSARTLEGGD